MLAIKAFAVFAIFLSPWLLSLGQQVATPDYAIYAAAIRSDIRPNASSIVLISDLLPYQESAQLAAEDILAQDNRNLVTYYPGLNIAAIDAPTLEAVKSYKTATNLAGNIGLGFASSIPTTFITKRRFNKFRKRNPDKGWRSFYKKYPGADGVFEFSRIGYSADKTRAVVYRAVRRNGFNGEGALLLLENTSTGWVVKHRINLWNN